jgi:hypothetical protein
VSEKLEGWDPVAAGIEAGKRDREMRDSMRQRRLVKEREWAEYMGNGRDSLTPPVDEDEEWHKARARDAALNVERFMLEVKK